MQVLYGTPPKKDTLTKHWLSTKNSSARFVTNNYRIYLKEEHQHNSFAKNDE